MAGRDSNFFGNRMVVILAFLLLAALTYAADPTTTASATVNGATYNFGDWANASVSVTLTCNAGGSDCADTYYCVDTPGGCDPTTAGTAYSSAVSVSGEGTSYIRYASNSSAGTWGDVASSTIRIDTKGPYFTWNDNVSANWTNNDLIAINVYDSGAGVLETRWIIISSSSCDSDEDSALDAGNASTYAYAKNDTTFKDKYICFRATDQVGNKNYTVSAQINYVDATGPVVNAGADKTEKEQFTQDATVSESGSGIFSYSWAKVSGPGTVTFGTSSSEDTTISASEDGTYVISLTVTDNAGNTGYDTFTLVRDAVAPTISINNQDTTPAQSKTISASASEGTLTMAVTTEDMCSEGLGFGAYSAVTFSSESDNGKRVCYKAVDTAGNTVYAISNEIIGIQTTKPVITLKGNANVAVEVRSNYVDAGATASGKYDGDISVNIVTDNQVSSTMIGTYNVTYDVTDAAGNKAERVTRTVNVVDTTKPVIILNGNSTVTVLINTNYTDAGATASDNYDGDLTAKIVSDDQVDTSKVGTYTVTYDVTDAAGNGAEQAMRTVNVTETGGIGFLLILALIVLAILGIGAYIVFVRRSRN